MKRPPIRILDLEGSPAEIGRAHGTEFAAEIRRYTDERVGLVASGTWSGGALDRSDVLALAESMLPAHEEFDPDLHVEMLAMAEAAGISPAEAVIVGGFTDFVDTVRASVGGAVPSTLLEDDCTAVIVPDGRADGAGFLAQTWDMHDSATEYVVMLEVRPESDPAALVFSTVGCLGQIGMNEAGIAVGINNLTASHGQRGVTWPLVVRKALKQTTLDAALRCVMEADLAGAHNYLLFDAKGDGYNVEAMPGCTRVEALGDVPLVHTNHCIDAMAARHQAEKDAALMDSSVDRLARANALCEARPLDFEQLAALTRDPGVCQRAQPPFHIESSGAAIMRPATGDLWAVWGLPAEGEYERLRFDDPTQTD